MLPQKLAAAVQTAAYRSYRAADVLRDLLVAISLYVRQHHCFAVVARQRRERPADAHSGLGAKIGLLRHGARPVVREAGEQRRAAAIARRRRGSPRAGCAAARAIRLQRADGGVRVAAPTIDRQIGEYPE